ncbi:hypothetical protein [Nocardia sp. NBC_01388]|uniref:hypothetical protein n=1 Tax=Nocardia sp. NBC_01388 TaxID=2903596 RepID=UPI00324E538A
MKFEDTYFSRELRFAVGVEQQSGKYYLSIPVSNGLVDYDEYYELDPATYERFIEDHAAASDFAIQCRRHEKDDLLIMKPGSNRGVAI